MTRWQHNAKVAEHSRKYNPSSPHEGSSYSLKFYAIGSKFFISPFLLVLLPGTLVQVQDPQEEQVLCDKLADAQEP